MAIQRDRVREQLGRILMLRVRSGLIMCILATFGVMLIDSFPLRQLEIGTQLARVVILSLLVVGLRLTRQTSWQRALGAALFGILIYIALITGIGMFGFTTTTRAYLLIALAMGTAAHLPWGPGPQTIAVVMILLALQIAPAFDVTDHGLNTVQLSQLSVALALTIFMARELHRQTVARVDELLSRQQKEHALAEEATVSSALVRVGREMLSVADSPDLLERLCRVTAENLHCDASHVFLWDPKEDFYLCIAGHGDTPEQEEILRVLRVPGRVIESIVATVKKEGLIQVDFATMEPGAARLLAEPFGLQRTLFLALHRRDELLGILTASRRRSARPFHAVEERIGRGIAQFATMSLQNLSLLQSLRHANTLKSEFVATMSHELRTPLHILMGYADLMRDGEFGEVNEEQQRILDLMDKNAHDLLDLINTTLDLSRLEAGRIRVDQSRFSVRELLAEVEADLASAVRSHPEILFVAQAPPDLPLVTSDKAKLKVILKNLIGNAFKFTDRGRIEVRAESRDRGIELTVADTGIGISADVQPIIFDAFHQGESSMTRSRGGVGLGLYIVRRLVAILHGRVRLASTGPRGSTFSVWIPFAPPSPQVVEEAPVAGAYEPREVIAALSTK